MQLHVPLFWKYYNILWCELLIDCITCTNSFPLCTQARKNFMILRACYVNVPKTLPGIKLIRLLPLHHISQRIRSSSYVYKYCYMQCSVLFSHIKNSVLKMILDALFEFKSSDKYERKMLNRLKRNFKRKIYINSFCLMSQVLFFFGAGRWTDGKRMKQKKVV